MKVSRWFGVGGLLVAAGSIAAFVIEVQAPPVVGKPVHDEYPVVRVSQPLMYYGVSIENDEVHEGRVVRNQMLADIFRDYHVEEKFIRQLTLIPRCLFDVRKIIAGKKYQMICSLDTMARPKAFIYEPGPIDYVVMRFEDTLYVDVCQRTVDTIRRTVAGVIESSLAETIQELGISHELTNRVVDIFAWQIDFQRLSVGDRFKLIYDELQVEGQPVGVQQIGGADFVHDNNDYFAFPFDQGEGLDYFDVEGSSLRKALLKYPIEFTRISSRYSYHRFHPVQKVFKPHLGTDFAAATGTPIRSVGDGTVLEARYSTFNGNYVKIRHNATYTTQYLHMSRFAPGIHPGVHVKQGQWIGNVGSTGLANGPHLCFRFWKNGVQVDALRVKLPPATPVKEEYELAFRQKRDRWRRELDQIEFPVTMQFARSN